jgi:hypothetical protein
MSGAEWGREVEMTMHTQVEQFAEQFEAINGEITVRDV